MAVSGQAAVLEDGLLDELRAIFGDRLSLADAVREQHGRDESYHAAHAPDAVVFPADNEEVQAVVRACARHHVPVIPFGIGTSLEGQVAAICGGVCVDLSRMDAVLEVHAQDMDATVQAGATGSKLNSYLRDTGLFFAVDPGADATLGGMAATRASGTNAVRYGTMRETVLGLGVVLADGRFIRTSRRARKSAAGYDLTRLFVGSEGTLGVITEVTVRLHGIPEATSAAVAAFADLDSAVSTVIETIQSGVPVARIELLDDVSMDAINRFSGLSYELTPTLFFEFHGSTRGVVEQAQTVEAIAGEHACKGFHWATDADERAHLWQARHDAYYACLALRPGSKGLATDVCVPVSRLAECIVETRRDIDESFLIAPIVGHVGDGNFHVVMLLDPENADEVAEAKRLNERMVMRALAMDGTCTGEHGVGTGKMEFLMAEHGEAVSVMRALKRALDPDNIMNPGKILIV
ncbi:MAG: FAD-linked oxidase C-terminal domain-containing protein [Rhodospirillales bacterium]|jgi:D-lactate dehydrogenase (cytochrome)|nr:FAD-linked oxidase C-terminal domain-containing protein [Rhodospirillales bacterium]